MAPPSQSSSSSCLPVIEEILNLIPGLPDDVAAFTLSFIPYSHHTRLKSTCKSWRQFFSSKTFLSLRHTHQASLSQLLCIFPQDPFISSPFLFDPQNLAWCPLPPMPCNPHVYGLCNFASVAVGPYLYVIGGSLFDTRSFPIDRPSPTALTFRFDFFTFSWECLAPMLSPRGSFACAVVPNLGQILVAGGGSRHTMFAAAGSRMCSVEMYDVVKNEWAALDGLPKFRAGCVGFFLGKGEFWVMGGYGESRTISGVFPVDDYYRDAVVMKLENGNFGGRWREVGDMWAEGERGGLGKIVVVDDENGRLPLVFMLEGNDILRYDMASNRWQEESRVPRKTRCNKTLGNLPRSFVVLDGELHVITYLKVDSREIQRSWQPRTTKVIGGAFCMQIYHPKKKTWRSLTTKSPFSFPLDSKARVTCCTISL